MDMSDSRIRKGIIKIQALK